MGTLGKYKYEHSPIGMVSKNDAGDLNTPDRAALNKFLLATKLTSLFVLSASFL